MSERSSWRECLFAVALVGALSFTHSTKAGQELAANGGAEISASTDLKASEPDQSPDDQQVTDGKSSNGEPQTPSSAAESKRAAPVNERKALGPKGNHALGHEEATSDRGSLDAAAPSIPQHELVKVSAALAIVLGLIVIARSFARRSGKLMGAISRPSGVVEVLARYPLGGRGQHLILLKVARRIVLLHQSGAAMTVVTEMQDPDEVAALLSRMEAGSDSRSAAKFRSTLEQFMNDSQASSKRSGRGDERRSALPQGDAEIIDLTRRNRGFFASIFGPRGDSK